MAMQAQFVVESPMPAIEVPPLALPTYIREKARERPDERAIVDSASGRSLRYSQLDSHIGRVAAGLAARGLRRGDTLLVVAPNVPEWPIVALGALAAGGIVSGANPMSSATELARQLGDTNAGFVFTIPALRSTVGEASAAAHRDARVIVLGDATADITYESLLACTDPEPQLPEDPDALAALPYSSGTTGTQKGVMLTHRTILSNLLQFNAALDEPGVTDPIVALVVLPMFHILGFVITLWGLLKGATLVTLSRFEPEAFLKALQDYRVTQLGVVPPILHFLATHPLVSTYDLSSLRFIGCGAAPLGETLERKAAERLGCRVAQGFGMTESSGAVSVSYFVRARPGSSGQLLPGTQARVVDPVTGVDIARGETGEIWFRGPQSFKGYLNQPEATASTITSDGWVRTGDIGRIDADGFLYVTDRLKELLKVKGFQVVPAELEALLCMHPQVADAAVIGRTDERSGDVPVAYIVARGQLDPQELKCWVAERVCEYKQLAEVVLCDAIPKAPSGKILRRVLRVQDAQRRGNSTA